MKYSPVKVYANKQHQPPPQKKQTDKQTQKAKNPQPVGKILLRAIWIKHGGLNLPLPEKLVIGQVLPNTGS